MVTAVLVRTLKNQQVNKMETGSFLVLMGFLLLFVNCDKTFIGMKRGEHGKRMTTISDTHTVIQELKNVERSQINVVTNVKTVISNQNHLIDKMEENQIEMKENQNKLQKNLNEMKVSENQMKEIQYKMQMKQNEMETTVNTVIMKQNLLIDKMDYLISVQGDLINKVNTIVSLNLSEILETALDRDEVLESNDILQTQLTETMSTTQKSPLPVVWLVNGSTIYEGRVEVNYQGRRGTVCDDSWDNNDAKVVCRMLGYSGGTALIGPRDSRGRSFGVGTGEILLDNVHCTGCERSLFDCKHNGIGVENCVHGEDAGVICNP